VQASIWLKRFAFLVLAAATAGTAAAQQPPAPDPDAPTIRLGATLYADYTFTTSPETTDADGNSIHSNSFNVGRSYLNITGNLSHLIAFRITPDIARETGTGSTLNGSYVFRIKYAFGQFNLDDWMTAGSWARLGIQQTPWVDFEENIYRYRFQGTVFSEREGFLSSSDAGASFHYNLPSNFGDVHAGIYNGENYNRFEVNDQKAFQVRGTVRPFAASSFGPLRGLRGHLFYDADHYVKAAERQRFIGSVTFEHSNLNAGFEYLNAADQPLGASPRVDSHGYSLWATPRLEGWEALLRFDRLTPNTLMDSQTRNRTILGVAYWFRLQSPVTTALLLDYDSATFEHFTPAQPDQRRIALHGLVNF
jgi:hypothetical protein